VGEGEDSAGGLAIELGERRCQADRPRPHAGNAKNGIFRQFFFDTHIVEHSFSLWASENPSSFPYLVDF